MGLDKSGLQERSFEVSSVTNEKIYYFLCNMDTRVSRWSKNAVEYFGLPGEYLYDGKLIWESFIHPDDLEDYREFIVRLWNKADVMDDFDCRVRNKDGGYVHCTCRCIVLKGKEGESDLFTGTVINHGIQDSIDPVTNLYSNQEFSVGLRRVIAERRAVTVFKVGINLFNHFNVMYGYDYGDRVLARFAECIREVVADYGENTVYRLEGAKFAILCYGMTDQEQARKLYNEIRKKSEDKIEVDSVMVPLTISGSAMVLDNYDGTDVAIKSGLSYALSQSKHEMHGELVMFQEKGTEDTKRLVLIGAIHRCILDNCKGFYLCYQPLVSVENERIAGAEALLRWRQEPYGDVPPGLFIPWLETDPAFYELGNWILRTALTDMAEIKKKNPDFILNVNIAASQLEHRDFRQSVMQIVKETGFPPQDLIMELTERCRNLDFAFLRGEMEFFHSQGIKLSLDDFGTGSSSLSLLRELPIDELKIDMSFIRNIETNSTDQSLVRNIIQIAKELGFKTCLEGVETESISQYLKQHSATYYQGYYYSKPVPMDEFRKMMLE